MSVLHSDPLQGLVFITSDLRIWSGGVKLTRDHDLSEVQDQLPPKGMVSDGRKNLVKPQALAPFHAIRKRLERLLGRQGFRLMSSDAFAVPESEVDAIVNEITTMERDFNDLVPQFIADLPRHYREQEDEFPEWKELLRDGQLSTATVASRMRFAVGVYKIAPPDPSGSSTLARQYENVVNSAVPALLADVSGKAQELLKGPIGKKLICTQAHHAQVRKLVERLDAFSFLDHRVGPSADAFLEMLGGVPNMGPLSAGNTAVLRVVVEQLSDPEGILQELEVDEQEPVPAPPAITPVSAQASPAAISTNSPYVGL